MTNDEPMQYASGYQLDLYCDTCYGKRPRYSSPAVYTGESFAQCAKQARREGWIVRTDTRTARCPRCKHPNAVI